MPALYGSIGFVCTPITMYRIVINPTHKERSIFRVNSIFLRSERILKKMFKLNFWNSSTYDTVTH
jgi:hypothetical protein